MTEKVDVVVVGMGVGGEEVAGRLAEAGLSVVGIEGRLVGGECPYWGCVPSKMMIRAGNLLAEGRRVDGMAGHPVVVSDWRPVATRIRSEATDNWNDKVAVDRFVGKGGRFVRGWGWLAGRTDDGAIRVEVEDQAFDARRGVVLGVGTVPAIPPIEGLAGTPYWTNREAIEANPLPSSLIVLGGGAIGVELAQVYARFEVRVTVVEAIDRLLPMEEPEASELARKALETDGLTVRTGAKAVRVAHTLDGFIVELDDGTELTGERLLVAVGRRGKLDMLGLESVDLDPDARAIAVDERMRVGTTSSESAGPESAEAESAEPAGSESAEPEPESSEPAGLWAVGDVTGQGAFTHVAMYQAGIAVRDILGLDGPTADYRAVPRVTFTDPEIGSVGLSEARAREDGLDVRVGFSQLPSSARGWIHKAGNDGFVKLVADAERDVLVGATSAGPMGGEVLGALVLAVQAQVPLDQLRQMIYAYPTFHRAIEDALRDLG